MRKREEVAFPHFFFFLQFNDYSAVIVAAAYTRSLDLAFQLVCRSVCRYLTVHFLTIPRI